MQLRSRYIPSPFDTPPSSDMIPANTPQTIENKIDWTDYMIISPLTAIILLYVYATVQTVFFKNT